MRRYRRSVLAGLAMLMTSASPVPGREGSDGEKHIRNLAGCFEVTYRFVEDGTHDTFASEQPLSVHEWIALRTGPDKSITLLHVSITPDGQAVPHWYEVWRKDANAKADVWNQQVWSDRPGHPRSELRYECSAPWTANRWQCHAGKSPKPFRDSGAPFGFDRTDYEWLDRENVLLVTGKGWVHNEHNRKVDSTGKTVAFELGWITYARVADTACRGAIEQFGRQREDP